MTITIGDLRHFAVTRSLFPPTTLMEALERLGFVQANPIRAPARAQDLILRQRVRDYRAGDLERRYEQLDVEEDVFINYGFVPGRVQALMQPRGLVSRWRGTRRKRSRALLAFLRDRGEAHPRDVDAHFAHGSVVNYWGGSSNATTQLLEAMHYAGQLRVVRRVAGIRVYAPADFPPPPRDRAGRLARIAALVDIVVRQYAPLPATGLRSLVGRLRYAVPQWRSELPRALESAKERLAHATVDGVHWYWPADEAPDAKQALERARFLAPFDPIVWDRSRFERLWGWTYRFEAYTPPAKRKLGYYALPLLWREQVVGWGNLSLKAGALEANVGYGEGRPPTRCLLRPGARGGTRTGARIPRPRRRYDARRLALLRPVNRFSLSPLDALEVREQACARASLRRRHRPEVDRPAVHSGFLLRHPSPISQKSDATRVPGFRSRRSLARSADEPRARGTA